MVNYYYTVRFEKEIVEEKRTIVREVVCMDKKQIEDNIARFFVGTKVTSPKYQKDQFTAYFDSEDGFAELFPDLIKRYRTFIKVARYEFGTGKHLNDRYIFLDRNGYIEDTSYLHAEAADVVLEYFDIQEFFSEQLIQEDFYQ